MAITFGTVLVFAIFILLLVVLVCGIGWSIRNNRLPSSPVPEVLTNVLVWSGASPSTNTDKNTCQVYQFDPYYTDMTNVTVAAGNPTMNSLILDTMIGSKQLPSCIDEDQIIAQQVIHECVAPLGVIDNQITRCLLLEGGTTGLGGTQTYYSNELCSTIELCPGSLSLVSINFQAPNAPEMYCIRSSGSVATMAECNPMETQQLFRVTRINYGQDPRKLSAGSPQTGMITKIFDRQNNLCLTSGTGTIYSNYNPGFLGITGCSGAQVSISGTNVLVSDCGTGTTAGYEWALLPSIRYSVEDPDNPEETITTVTPQQIVYVGDLDLSGAPSPLGGNTGTTGSNAWFSWLLDNNAKALYYGGYGDVVMLKNMGTDATVCAEKPYTAQYMNITTFNTISAQAACLASGTLGTQYCVGF